MNTETYFEIEHGGKYYFELKKVVAADDRHIVSLILKTTDEDIEIFIPCIRVSFFTLQQYKTGAVFLAMSDDRFSLRQRKFNGPRGYLARKISLSHHVSGDKSIFLFLALNTVFNRFVLRRGIELSTNDIQEIANASRKLSVQRTHYRALEKMRSEEVARPSRSDDIIVLVRSNNTIADIWQLELQYLIPKNNIIYCIDDYKSTKGISGLIFISDYIYQQSFVNNKTFIYLELEKSEGGPGSDIIEWLTNRNTLERVFGNDRLFKQNCVNFEKNPMLGLLICQNPADRDGKPHFVIMADQIAASNNLNTQSGFWLRSQALSQVWDLNISLSNKKFEKDCFLLSEIDRLLCVIVQRSGYEIDIAQKREYLSTSSRSVMDAGWTSIRRKDQRSRYLAIFVTLALDGEINLIARSLSKAIKDVGFDVVMVAVTQDQSFDLEPIDEQICDGLISRNNEGYDFAAWAAALRRIENIMSYSGVLIINDSIIGPLGDIKTLMEKVFVSTADVVVLTDSNLHKLHSQSYFTFFGQTALKSDVFWTFWNSVKSLPTKDDVIRAYELEMMSKMEEGGLKFETLFPIVGSHINPTHQRWRQLIDNGFPFIKAELLRDNPTGADLTGWREVFLRSGWQPEEIVRHLKDRRQTPAACAFS